jgi:D-alanyl-D-alanine carboxypeptidase
VITLGIPADYGQSRGLQIQAEATELVPVASHPDGRNIQLAPSAARAWNRMRDGALHSGVTLIAVSGFRSVERQAAIINAKLLEGEALADILKAVAAPGYSEHHTGRAVDIAVPEQPRLTEAFAKTRAFHWLEEYAGAYAFRLSYPKDNPQGFIYEPWHWCFVHK